MLQKYRLGCVTMFLVLSAYGIFYQRLDYSVAFPKSHLGLKQQTSKKTEKWIVVTSIQLPTEDVKRLAASPEWTLVVVGDKKTPAEWHLPDVHFLSVESQEKLGYNILSDTPYGSYTRKNIGYLYAIQNGAQWIYDTDDDNKPFGKGLAQFDYDDDVSGLRFHLSEIEANSSSARLFNPYYFAGQREMWPRGFPLDHIKGYSPANDSLRLCKKHVRAAVQQGLVHHDPDVDAVYRLLHADRSAGLDERFNNIMPPVTLARGTYSPWNSQNTLFSRRAFHTLFLPTSVSFRTTDIWRSFFAQKILHLAGDEIAFTPVNAIQIRNAHDYLKDFESEGDVYLKSGAIIDFLDGWECDKQSLSECMIDLADAFAEREFWGAADAALARHWLADLARIGYQLPPLKDPSDNSTDYPLEEESKRLKNCRRAQLELSVDLPSSSDQPAYRRAELAVEMFGELADWCGADVGFHRKTNEDEDDDEIFFESNDTSKSTRMPPAKGRFPPIKKIAERWQNEENIKQKTRLVAIVTNNFDWGASMGILQRLYQPFFAHTIFCSTFYPWRINEDGFPPRRSTFSYVHISWQEIKNGMHGYACMNRVHEMRLQNVEGYVMFSDDLIYNLWQPLDAGVLNHCVGIANSGKSVQWWRMSVGMTAANKTVELYRGKYAADAEKQAALATYADGLYRMNFTEKNSTEEALKEFTMLDGWAVSDWYYVPLANMSFHYQVMEVFYEARLFHEIAVNKLLHTVPHISWRPSQTFLWGGWRHAWHKFMNASQVLLHPVKMSTFAKIKERKEQFCSSVLRTFIEVLIDGAPFNNSVTVFKGFAF